MANIILPKDFNKDKAVAESLRKQEDIKSGLSKTKGAQRGDYVICGELDKVLVDLRRFKNTEDRKKINDEYYGREKAYRDSQQKKMGV